jgi:hypothetical protein
MFRDSNWKIAVYADEHGEPHFHIETPNGRCSVSIERLEVIVGEVNPRTLKAALAWAVEHQDALRAKWRGLNP